MDEGTQGTKAWRKAERLREALQLILKDPESRVSVSTARIANEALSDTPDQDDAPIPEFDGLSEAAGAAVIAEAVAKHVSEEHQILGRFALEVWRQVKAQGANDIAALTCVYHAGMTHIREAMGIPYKTAADVFGSSDTTPKLPIADAEKGDAVDSMGMPLSCGKPHCSVTEHHPLCKLYTPPVAEAKSRLDDVRTRLDFVLGYCQARTGVPLPSEAIQAIKEARAMLAAAAEPNLPPPMPLPDQSTGDVGSDLRELGKAIGWNMCRAATLAASPLPEGWRDAFIAVCSAWDGCDQFVTRNFALLGDAIESYPVVQGTSNQIATRRIGRAPYDGKRAAAAIHQLAQMLAPVSATVTRADP